MNVRPGGTSSLRGQGHFNFGRLCRLVKRALIKTALILKRRVMYFCIRSVLHTNSTIGISMIQARCDYSSGLIVWASR